ncbi:malonic semialdehyde reductase [bacterium]|nr:malonic semialdehyde reductase [bacterium]
MSEPVDPRAVAQIFTEARTHTAWLDKDVPDDLLHHIYDIMKFGPTSANCCPLRIVFVKSPEAKEKLKPCLDGGNVEKTMKAPVTAILAMDMEFYEKMPKLFPHNPGAREWFAGKDAYIQSTAFRNSSLQGAYFMLAARALGLDCGPMSGFKNKMVDEVFFAGTKNQSNFLCNLGYGDVSTLHPRSPRLDFDEAATIA